MRTPTFNDVAVAEGHPGRAVRRVPFLMGDVDRPVGDLRRPAARFPFVPDDPERLHEDCYEAFNIQVDGLTRRLTGHRQPHAADRGVGRHRLDPRADRGRQGDGPAGRPRTDIHAVTMPGFATSEGTRSQRLAADGGHGGRPRRRSTSGLRPARCSTTSTIPTARARRSTTSPSRTSRPGLRTDYLFRLANQRSGFVLGTGDLSEMALGWCTYGVGDQMSHYDVNTGRAQDPDPAPDPLGVTSQPVRRADGPGAAGHPGHRDLTGARAGR